MNNLEINKLKNAGGVLHLLFLLIYFLLVIFALYVVGIIEYDFLKGIFSSDKYVKWCLWAVIVFEGFKGFAIYFHRYVEYYSDFGLTLSKRLKFYLRIGRYFAFVISFVVGVAKVSEYLDSPNFDAVWENEEKQLLDSYSLKKTIMIKERDSLNERILDFNKNRDKQTRRNINRLNYLDLSNYDLEDIEKKAKSIQAANKLQVLSNSDAIQFEQTRVNNLSKNIFNWNEIVNDSIKSNKKRLLKEYWRTENATVVGVYRLFEELSKRLDITIKFKEFKYLYTLLIAFLVSALLELVIMNVFNYTSLVFFTRLDRPKERDSRVKQ